MLVMNQLIFANKLNNIDKNIKSVENQKKFLTTLKADYFQQKNLEPEPEPETEPKHRNRN